MNTIDATLDKLGAIGAFCMILPLIVDMGEKAVMFSLAGLFMVAISIGWGLRKMGGE